MFEVNGEYINRKGKYTVLDINPPKMSVCYEDGSYADLNIGIQARIWENILLEQEAEASRRSARAKSNGKTTTDRTQHFVKTVTIPSVAEFVFAGWQERVIMANDKEAKMLNAGDRIIFYALDTQNFVAVATITEQAKKADPKEFFYTVEIESAFFFPIDIDASANDLTKGVAYDSLELESQPNFKKLTLEPESYLRVNEDDFELLAELLTEIAENNEEEDLDNKEYEEEDEE